MEDIVEQLQEGDYPRGSLEAENTQAPVLCGSHLETEREREVASKDIVITGHVVGVSAVLWVSQIEGWGGRRYHM